MVCPRCGGRSHVKDSAFNKDTVEYYRRRKCYSCHRVFYTMEFEVEFNDDFKREWTKYHRLTKLSKSDTSKLDSTISEVLTNAGIPAHLNGFTMMCTAIRILMFEYVDATTDKLTAYNTICSRISRVTNETTDNVREYVSYAAKYAIGNDRFDDEKIFDFLLQCLVDVQASDWLGDLT